MMLDASADGIVDFDEVVFDVFLFIILSLISVIIKDVCNDFAFRIFFFPFDGLSYGMASSGMPCLTLLI
jgi:hypothetical protein